MIIRAGPSGASGYALVALSLAGCTAPSITAEAPKSVTGQALAPYASHEECLRLVPGDRVDYTFDSTEPVAFHILFRAGNAVVMPVVRENTRADAGIFAPPTEEHYCLTWEAGPAGALIEYRIRLRR